MGGIFHTDELPAYGVTEEEVTMLRSHMHAGEQDCVIIVSGANEKQAACALNQVIIRAGIALSDTPVPEETRKMLEEGSTAYMRPLPGAARMYPETDVLPVVIGEGRWNSVIIPELLTHKAKRYAKDYAIDLNYALQLAASDKLPLFERAVNEKIKPKLAAFTILSTATNSGARVLISVQYQMRVTSPSGMRWKTDGQQRKPFRISSAALLQAVPQTQPLHSSPLPSRAQNSRPSLKRSSPPARTL